MLDLSIITDDRHQCVYCRTIEQASEFYNAVKEQRPDISLKNWDEPPNRPDQADMAYILSYHGTKRLLYGPLDSLKRQGCQIFQFEDLTFIEDLSEFESYPSGLSALLGV